MGDEDNVEALRKRTAQIDKSRTGGDYGASAAKKSKSVFDMDNFDIFKTNEKKANDEDDGDE